jgi:hypothetical protein
MDARRFANILLFAIGATASVLAVGACSKSSDTTAPGADAADGGAAEVASGAPPGCFTGSPSQPSDFLNACTDAAYVVFDNCARLGLCGDAGLPDRVPPPSD